MNRIADNFTHNFPSKRIKPNKYNDHVLAVNRYLPWFMVKETKGKSVCVSNPLSIEETEEMEYRPKV